MKLSRRTLLAGTTIAVAAPTILRRPAHAAEFNFKCGASLPDGHPMGIRAREAMQAIRRKAAGGSILRSIPTAFSAATRR